MVSAWRIDVRTDDETDPTVAKMAHRLLLARRLAVIIDDVGGSGLAKRMHLEITIDHAECIIDQIQEQTS